jgi:class 3 adenylate cyclase
MGAPYGLRSRLRHILDIGPGASRWRGAPRALRIHVGIYLVFVCFWLAIWVFTGAGYFWPVWPALGWGLAVAIHAIVALNAAPPTAHARADRTGRNVAAEPTAEPRLRQSDGSATGRRWVTIMFTDIASSTSLNEALGDEEWSRFIARHREMLRATFRARDGTEVGTQGDGLLVRFSTPANAVLCAIDIQRRIDEVREGGGLVPHIRIGIHAGEAVEDQGDIVGRVVNLAARVTSEAAPGEILVTEPVADELAGRIELEDRGLRPLRGVPQPRHLLAVRWT